MELARGCRIWDRYGNRRTAAFIAWALFLPGCALHERLHPTTMSTVPREWRTTNPWGPEAMEARARGELQPLFYTQEMAGWAAFARENLQDGDILFRYGRNSKLTDRFVNGVLTGVQDSSFTHDAIVFHQGDEVWVYDAQPEPQGVRKLPFEFYMLDTVPGTFAVKRLKEPYRGCIPQALTYCEEAWHRQPPFDNALSLDDDRLYCSEMIEKAFRSAGLSLSEPITNRCLPRYNHYRFLGPATERFTEIRIDEPEFALGNDYYGTYGSPYLELVFGAEKHKHRPQKPPICPPVPFPAKAEFVAPAAPDAQ